MQMMRWVWDNREWVFSGIGILLITTVVTIIKICCHRVKPKQAERSAADEKHLETYDMKISGGNNNIQIGTIGSINVTNHPSEDKSVILTRTMEKALHDAEFSIRNMEESYIKTENYRQAEKQLEENNILILTGYPLMGKTETAFSLLSKFRHQFTIFSLEGVDELLEYLEKADDKTELFFIDDLLGQSVYEYSAGKAKCFKKLIDIMLKSSGKKKLILTVRETILKDFFQQNPDIETLLDLNSVPIINVNFQSSEIRTEFIKESLERTGTNNELGLDKDKAEFLCEKESLKLITESICFTPLAINRLLKPQKDISLEEYKKQFHRYMTDADFIWRKELDALNEYSRLYLYIIYSLTDKMVKKDIADQCFRTLVKENLNCKFSMQECVESMKGVLVNIQEQKGSQSIGLIHPSLNEYIEKHIPDKQALGIAGHACYLDQLERLEKYAENLIEQKLHCPYEFLSLGLVAEEENTFHALFQETKPIKYAKYLLKYNIRDKSLENEIIMIADLLLYENHFTLMKYEDIVVPFFLSDFYDMGNLLNRPHCFQTLLEISSRENMCRLFEKTGYYKNGFIDYRELAEKEPYVAGIVRQVLEGEAESAVIQEAEKLLDDWEMGDYEEMSVEDAIEQIAFDLLENASFADTASRAFDEAAKRSRITHCECDVNDIIDGVVQNQLYDLIQEKIEEA